MKNKYNYISLNKLKIFSVWIIIFIIKFTNAQQAPSIQTGVTFQWMAAQPLTTSEAEIESVTINGVLYNTFVVPSEYELTRLGPDGNANNKIIENGITLANSSADPNWNILALEAFKDKNLNHIFDASGNGANICNDFDALETTYAQKQTIFYENPIPSNDGGVLAVTEKGGNNCYYIEVWGTPVGGGPEQKLGQTFVRNSGDYYGSGFAAPNTGSDYWKSGRQNHNGQSIAIALFYLNNLAPTGSLITKIEFVGATRDHGDGKFFLLQKYAVDQQLIECLDETYNGDLKVINNEPTNSTYTLISGPSSPGESFNFNTDGTYTYEPSQGFIGDVSFTYQLCLPDPNTDVCDLGTVILSYVDLPPEPSYEIDCTGGDDNFTLTITNPLNTDSDPNQYEYSIDGINYQASPIFSGLLEGTYTITVKSTYTDCVRTAASDAELVNDIEAPTGTAPSGETGVNLCMDDAESTYPFETTSIASNYSDYCSENLTINLINTVLSGDNCAWTLTYTYDVIDSSGNKLENETIVYSGSDQSAPTGSAPMGQSDINLCSADAISNTPFSDTIIASYYSDNCSNVTITLKNTELNGNDCSWSLKYTYDVLDECGNKLENESITHTGGNQTPLSFLSEASDFTVECNGDNSEDLQNWINNHGGATINSTCSSITWSDDYSDIDIDCGIAGTGMVTFTATDSCGNSISSSATFTVEDTTAPIIDIEASDLTVECDGSGNTSDINNWLTSNGGASASDNCSSVTWTNDYSALSDECGATGSTTVTFTATDACGNETITTATFTVEDTTAPIIDINANDLTVECDGSGNTSDINNWLTSNGGASASDNCSSVTWTNDYTALSDDCGSTGSTIVTFTATDDCGNTTTTTATFTIVDTTAPSINTQANNIVVECDGSGNNNDIQDWLNNNGGAVASDECSTITWTNNYDGTTSDCANAITVTFTATDECGNSSTTSATYAIEDTTPPTLNSLASDLTVECDGEGNISEFNTWLTNNGGASASDDCSAITWSNNYTSFSDECGTTGSATVTFTATDSCGNENKTTATFTIQDTTAPELPEAPADITYECIEDVPNPETLTATDSCSGDYTITGTDIIDETDSCNIIITRTWTFTDSCNNTSSVSQTITVKDTTPPVLVLPNNVSAECSNDLSPISFGSATATDNCDTNPIITFSDVITNGSCSGTYSITRTWMATDSCNNTTTADQTISVSDTTAPEFDQTELPQDVTVECDAIPETITLTATDNCSEATVTLDEEIISGNCEQNYTIIRTYTATDECGLTRTHIQTITVQDTTPPEFVELLPLANIVVECDAVPTPEILTATDTCSSATVTVNDTRTDGTCENNYTLARTWIATDACGLTTSFTQNIVVQDTTAPTFNESLPRDITVECNEIPEAENLTASDNCGSATVTVEDTITNGNCPSSYIITRVWIATDECGLTSNHIQTITVQDTTAPQLASPFDETLDISCTDIPDIPNLEFSDNCSENLTVNYEEESSFEDNVFEDYVITRTWTVIDECANQAIFTQTLNVTLDEIYSEIVAQDVCYDNGAVNLDDTLTSDINLNGTWEIIEGNTNATLTGNIFDPTNLQLSEDFLPESGGIDYRFRYTTTDQGCLSVTEVTMNVHADCVVLPCGENDIKISKAITPNGDGYNDTFDIEGIDLCGFVAEVKIFNRWGALVFESNNYTLGSTETSGAHGDWDGSSPNSSVGTSGKLPNGTYYYIIKLRDSGLNALTGPIYLGTK
ncbi:HYR-like domain-containing protein [Neotamlana laminarinivorans]|uniref:Gliding motility-associated C-terminal domain-containing protein n=1 Tax=Neotamlana laminarinivorans TaxID=2883124 RepID=A0A9X1L0I6_9FLAO|nr:gliding motility-associated C-terminal domain-containing protein [Tamlana laminarinivorans]MCB4797818.1 gliding motility-associated C-terminal domain-containing protein [Tamlana laminarinivorans]